MLHIAISSVGNNSHPNIEIRGVRESECPDSMLLPPLPPDRTFLDLALLVHVQYEQNSRIGVMCTISRGMCVYWFLLEGMRWTLHKRRE